MLEWILLYMFIRWQSWVLTLLRYRSQELEILRPPPSQLPSSSSCSCPSPPRSDQICPAACSGQSQTKPWKKISKLRLSFNFATLNEPKKIVFVKTFLKIIYQNWGKLCFLGENKNASRFFIFSPNLKKQFLPPVKKLNFNSLHFIFNTCKQCEQFPKFFFMHLPKIYKILNFNDKWNRNVKESI